MSRIVTFVLPLTRIHGPVEDVIQNPLITCPFVALIGPEGVQEGGGVGVGEGVGDGVGVAVGVDVGVAVGVLVGVAVGLGVGVTVTHFQCVGCVSQKLGGAAPRPAKPVTATAATNSGTINFLNKSAPMLEYRVHLLTLARFHFLFPNNP